MPVNSPGTGSGRSPCWGRSWTAMGKTTRITLRFPGLLRRLHTIDGLERIRFLTSHPNWMTDELLRTAAELPKVMPHIEVPVQAGDDEVLLRMRRGYSAGEFRDLIGRIREDYSRGIHWH